MLGSNGASGGSGGVWGPGGGERGSSGNSTPTYSSITAINTSVRDKKNILEVRLEKQQGSTFNLTMPEIESLLRRLGIDSSHFTAVSSCPEGKPLVYITQRYIFFKMYHFFSRARDR